MKSLFEYINKISGCFVNESYNVVYDSAQKCWDAFAEKGHLSDDLEKFVNYMYNYWQSQGGDFTKTPFVFNPDPRQKVVKVNRIYRFNDDIQAFISSMGYSGVKDSFSINKQTLKWGNGTFSRLKNSTKIDPKIHETISTVVINKYFGTADSLSVEQLDLTGTIGEQYMQYKDWMTSWVQQFNTIKYQLKGWSDVFAVQYDDKDDPVIKTLRDLHARICKIKGIASKDALDPSDIILYKKSAQTEVVKRLTCVDSSDLFVDTKNKIIQMYNDKIYVGISLKKGVSFKPIKLNYDPKEGFENARIVKVNFDPMYDFFKNDKKMIDSFRKNTLHMDWNEYKKLNPFKTCQIVIDCDDEKGVILSIRTNNAGHRQSLICEPHLAKAKAQISKCPVSKWHSAIGSVDREYQSFINKNAKKVIYNIDDLCIRWQSIMNNFPNTTTVEDLRKLFELFGEFEQRAGDSVLWSIYNQIHFLWGYYNRKDPDLMRKILLWSEKIDKECLPYLLIKPA